MISFKHFISEATGFVLTKSAEVKYNKKPASFRDGQSSNGLQFSSQGYVELPKGTFLVPLPAGLFAVNTKEKFAFMVTNGKKSQLDQQDKLKSNQYSNTNDAPEWSSWSSYLKK